MNRSILEPVGDFTGVTTPTNSKLLDPGKIGLFLSFSSLACGGFLYLAFRSRTLVMFRLTDRLGLRSWIDGFRIVARPAKNVLPTWVEYSLPNAFWSFSMLLFLTVVWRDDDAQRHLWLAFAVIITLCSELFQGLGIVPGTFSWIDIAAIIGSYAAYGLVGWFILGTSARRKTKLGHFLGGDHGP